MPPRLADHPQDERSHLTITILALTNSLTFGEFYFIIITFVPLIKYLRSFVRTFVRTNEGNT